MADFDPDAFLAEQPAPAPAAAPAPTDFNPDEFLAQPAVQAPGQATSAANAELEQAPAETPEDREARRDAQLADAFKPLVGADVSHPDAEVRQISTALRVPTNIVRSNFRNFRESWLASKQDPAQWGKDNPELRKLIEDRPDLAREVTRTVELPALLKAFYFVADPINDVLESQPAQDLATLVTGGAFGEKKAPNADQLVAAQRAERDAPKPTTFYENASTQYVAQRPILAGIEAYRQAEKQSEVSSTYSRLLLARRYNASLADSPDVFAKPIDEEQLLNKIVDLKREASLGSPAEGELGKTLATIATTTASSVSGYKGGAVGFAAGTALNVATRGKSAAVTPFLAKAGLALTTMDQEMGSSYERLLGTKTETGELLTEPEAAAGAVVAGTLKTAVEIGTLGLEFQAMDIGGNVAKLAARDVTFRALLKKAAVARLKVGADEAGEELIQGPTEDAVTYFAQAMHSGSFGSTNPIDVVGASRSAQEAFVGTALGPLPVLGELHLVQRVAEHGREVQAGRKAAALAGLASSDEVRTLAEPVARLIEDTTAETGAPVTHVYVDAQAVQRLFQSKKVDEAPAMTQLLGETGPAKLQAAIATGAKLEVPLATYLEKWGGDALKPLVEHTTTEAVRQTPAQLKENAAANEAHAQQIAEQYVAKLQSDTQAHYEGLEQQLVAAGHTAEEAQRLIAPWLAFERTQNEAFGEPVVTQKVQVVGDKVEAVEPRPAAEQQLRERALQVPPAERANLLGLDENTGLPNGKHFAETPAPADKPLVAHFSVEGIKYVNDNVSHTRANLLYRTVARALHQANAANVSKVGGDFVAHVASPAEAAAIAKAVNRALPVKGFTVTAATGSTLDLATEAHTAAKTKAEAAGQRARARPVDPADPTGQTFLPPEKPLGLQGDVREVKFPSERAGGAVSRRFAARVAGLTQEQYFDEAYRDPSTGAWTALAWHHMERKAHVAAMDMRDLKLRNKLFGEVAGDQMIQAIGIAAAAVGGEQFDFSHLHGDEYAAQSDNVLELELFLHAVERWLEQHPIHAVNEVTGEESDEVVQLWHGIGPRSYEAADRDLNERKKSAKEHQRAAAGQVQGELAGGRSGPAGSEGATGGEGSGNQAVDQHAAAELRQKAVEKIASMRPRNRALAKAWLGFIDGKRPRPKISDRLEKLLGTYGLVDPAGFPFDENGNRLDKPLAGPRRKGKSDLTVGEKQAFQGQMRGDAPDYRLNQPDGHSGDARGYTELVRHGVERVIRIGLNKNADLSTFLHESGHAFLRIVFELAGKENAPERLLKDVDAILRHLGADAGATYTDLSVEQHEKFARSFEAYLFEGKAPSEALRSAFTRFALWLKGVYRTIAALNAPLNPEIRGVFDRLLATDQEIAGAQQRMGTATPLFSSPAEMFNLAPSDFLTPEQADQWQRYLDEQQAATSHAEVAARLQALKDRKRETEAWWKTEVDKQRAAAEEAYEALPGRQAQRLLRGEPVGDFLGIREPLSRAAVETAIGVDAGKKFQLAKDGANPDELAEQLGFATGKEMLEAVVAVPDKATWVKAQADAKLKELHPTALEDRDQLRAAVERGLHGDLTARVLFREWAQLRSFTGTNANPELPPIESIERAAVLIAEDRLVGKLNAAAAMQDERTAAEGAARALAKGDFEQAQVLKLQQLTSMFVARELQRGREERDAFLTLAGRLSKLKTRQQLGKASPTYLGGVDLLLEAFGLKQPQRREVPLPSVSDITAQMLAEEASVLFDEDLVNRLLARARPLAPENPTQWKKLTLGEMRAVEIALKNIQGAARSRTTVTDGETRAEKDFIIGQAVEEAQLHKQSAGELASSRSARDVVQVLKSLPSALSGPVLKIEVMTEWLGGSLVGKDPQNSVWFKYFIKPLQDAKVRESDFLKSTGKIILDAFDAMPDEVRRRSSELVDGRALFPHHEVSSEQNLAPPSRRYELLMMALNMGNASNESRLLEGRTVSAAEVMAAINTLTKAELDWVQAVWDACEQLQKPAFDVEERDSGVRPERIEARPLHTVHGVYRGGYFPAIYDARVERVGKVQDSSTFMDPTFGRYGTAHGHTKSRSEGFTGALSLEPSNIGRHLAQVAHDIAYREAIKSVGGLVVDSRIQSVLIDRLGEGRAKQFEQWVKDVGTARGVDGAVNAGIWLRGMRAIRANTVVAALGYAVPNMIEDLSGLLYSVPATDLNTRNMSAGLLEFCRDPLSKVKEVEEKSGTMRAANDQRLRDLTQKINELTLGTSLAGRSFRFVKHHAFVLLETSFKFTATPVWLGAYRQALGDGRSDADAITFADRVVRRAFPMHSAVDQAGIVRDKGWVGQTMMFYGFQSTASNVVLDLAQKFAEPADGARTRLNVSARAMGFMVAVAVVGGFLRGKGPDPDESWAEWARRMLLTESLSQIPIAGGDVGNWVSAKLRDKPVRARPGLLSGAAAGIGDAVLALKGDNPPAKKLEAIARAAGPLGIPGTAQATRTLSYWHDLYAGDVAAKGPADFLSGTIYGQKEDQPLNPFNIFSSQTQKPPLTRN